MKKNLLSILILALLLVNTVMTGFMMLTVMTTNSQATKLIADIAGALQLEANGGANGQGFSDSATGNIKVENMTTFELTGDDAMTITLKPSADGKAHYMLIDVVFSLNTGDEDYATYGSSEQMASMKSLIKSKVQGVISAYSMEEIQANEEGIKQEILEQVQELFNSRFIYDVSFSKELFQ